jgi:HK97 family phage major capsid protein
MSLKLKELNEQRGAKSKEARAIITTAATANRDLTADERSKVSGLHTEVENLDANIEIQVRQLAIEGNKGPRLSNDELRNVNRFDTGKLLRHLHRSAKGANVGAIDGIEAEMIQEGEREARAAGIESGGIMLPRILVRRQSRDNVEFRDMTAGTAGEGGQTVATTKAGLLDDFFNGSVIRQAGATVLEGLVSNLDIPRLAAGTTPAKKAENAAADEVSPTTAMLSLTPKRLPAYIDISELLLKQSSSAIETILRTHLTNQMLAVQEAAFFHGGGTNEANGIAGTSGIGSVAGGTNGLAPTLAHLIALETAVDTTNALLGNLRYVSNGQIRGKLKGTAINATYGDRMILGDSGLLNGYQPLFTNAVSRTLTKGSSSVASAIFFGNFADYYVGYWGGVSLELVRDKTNAIGGLYTLVASSYYDGGVVRPKSFAAMLDALGA